MYFLLEIGQAEALLDHEEEKTDGSVDKTASQSVIPDKDRQAG